MDLSFLKAQPVAQPLSNEGDVKKLYTHWRLRTMYAMFIGYAIFYFCRKNLSAATPALISDLGISKTQIGSIWSILYLTYGLSKLINGVIGDRANPRYFMALGIFFSAITNIAFGLSSSLIVLGIMWGLNGWFQGMGWPPCARLLTQWYSPNERGTKWGIWNSAHQVGGALILVMGGFLTEHYGWRTSFFIPAIIGLICAVFLVNRLRDTPESLGLPAIEVYRNDFPADADQMNVSSGPQPSAKEVFFDHVLKNKQIWFLSIANFFVYLVRYGALDWAPTFLVEVKHSSIANASLKTALFEVLGIAGAFFAGWASDKIFKGRRAPVNVLYMLFLTFAVLEFWVIPPGHPVLDACALGAVGFLVYGPQMLVGVSAADVVGKNAAATATGFTGLFGYLGSIVSGIGTGWIVDHYGWSGGFLFFTVSAIIGGFCFLATWGEGKRVRKINLAVNLKQSPISYI